MEIIDKAYFDFLKFCMKYSGIECLLCDKLNTNECFGQNFDELGDDCICCTPDGKEQCKFI